MCSEEEGAPDTSGLPRVDALWLRVTDVFMPPAGSYDTDYTRRLRTAVGGGYAVMAVMLPLVVLQRNEFQGVFGDLLYSAWTGSVPLSLACLALLRYGRLELVSNLMLAFFCSVFVAGGYFLGGPTSPMLYQVVSLPLAALLMLGRASTLVWIGVVFAIYGGFYALGASGHAFPLEGTQAERDRLWAVATCTLIPFAALLVAAFERARMQALATLTQANVDLEQARRAADAANERQTTFLKTMSHEIRTPLTAVLGFADVAGERIASADTEDASALVAIQDNARNLLKILDDLLDLSKIESGTIEIRLATTRLAELGEHVTGLLRAHAASKAVELVLELDPACPESIETDPLRLQQILVNLIGNAIKFSAGGAVHVRIRPQRLADADGVRIEVADSGIGMTREQITGLFEPFAQAESSTSRLYGGTGLGLSISRVLVSLLGGEIGVESRPGEGSTFRIDLPLAAAHGAVAVQAAPAATEAAAARSADAPLDCRVLVVDDTLDNRRLVKHFLTRAGAQVALAEGGEEALRRVAAAQASGEPYDLIVMDIQMPQMDGYTALRALRAAGCRVPIVAFTAHAMASEREHCRAAGFDDYASKPIDRAALLAFVRRNLERAVRAEPAEDRADARARPAASSQSRLRRWREALVNATVPPAERDQPAARHRAETLLWFAVATLPVLPLEAWAVDLVFPPEIARSLTLLILLAIPLNALLPLIYRWTASLLLAASSYYAYSTLLIAAVTYYQGGTGSSAVAWFTLVPMIALPIVGIRAACFWVAVSLTLHLGFWIATLRGHTLTNHIAPDLLAFAATISNTGVAVLAAAIGFMHERGKVEAVATLASANRWLADARQHAERAGRTKATFLANISHELRTPLTAILGFADLLLARAQESSAVRSAADSLRTIRRSGQQLLETINNLLDLAKIESGSLQVEEIELDPAQLLADALEPLRGRAQAKNLQLHLQLDTPVPLRMRGDPTRIAQVLTNLCDNAIKFTEAGEIRVAIGVSSFGGHDWLEIAVTDTGCGIPPEHLAALFSPFHQIDDSATRRHGGSGLGLALCRRLIHLLGGDIEVASAVGAGSCFALHLPLRAVPGSGLASAIPEARRRATRARRALALRLLLAEDGRDNQRLITRVLREAGAHVDVVDNGRLAVDHVLDALARGTPPDVVLMDMEMPVLDGFQASAALRHAGYDGAILALTAHSLADERERCLAAGCDDVASKPIDWPVLFDQLARLAHKPAR